MSVLLDPPIPDGFDVCNTEIMPGVPNLAYNLQVLVVVAAAAAAAVVIKFLNESLTNVNHLQK